MNTETVVVEGVVRADGTLVVEGKVPLPAGKVSVTVKPVPKPLTGSDVLASLREIQALREGDGVRADADAALAAAQRVRDEFQEQVEDLGRLQDECRRERREADAAGQVAG
jgi:hypothetical protein